MLKRLERGQQINVHVYVHIAVMQYNSSWYILEDEAISAVILVTWLSCAPLQVPDDGSDVLTKQWVDYHYSDGTSGTFTNAREVQKRFDLNPGRYIILPCAFKPGEEGDFLMRIFTEKSSEDRYVHVHEKFSALGSMDRV